MFGSEFGGLDGTVLGAQAARGLEDSRDDPFLGEPGSRERGILEPAHSQTAFPGAGCRCPKRLPASRTPHLIHHP